MVDLHHHLLPGLDDGSPDLETSVAMARIAAEDGITHVVCTPHASGRYTFDPEVVAAALDQLRAAVKSAGIPLELGSGCDFHMSYDNVEDAVAHRTRYTINGKSYILVELPDYGVPRNLNEAFYELQLAGMTPILTHPERNPTLQRDPNRMEDWLRSGVLVQVTANSVTGSMGKVAEKMSLDLLNKRWVHFLATDAHNVTTRPPRMRKAFEIVRKRFGAEYAERICVEYPRAVFEGRGFDVQDEPAQLYDRYAKAAATGFWKRLGQRLMRDPDA